MARPAELRAGADERDSLLPPRRRPARRRGAGLVRAIAANRRALLPLRPLVRELGRTVKDPWRTGPVFADRRAVVASLAPSQLVSARTDSSLTIELVETPLGTPKRLDAQTLSFRRGRIETGRVTGLTERLDLIEQLVGSRVDDVGTVLLPRDLVVLELAESEAVAAATELLVEGRKLVEEVERLVCALYDVPAELTKLVVEHAVARAARGLPAGD